MIVASRLALQRIVMGACCAAILGAILAAVPAPANAADLSLGPGWRSKHVTRTSVSWRDRCAYAGYYCLYAEYGFVYAYPFDDRPIAHRRHRRLARY
jgi:hypothetical protein